MLDENYISLTLANLKTIYNRTCKEHSRIEVAIEGNYHQADRVWENANAEENYEKIMKHIEVLDSEKEYLDNIKSGIDSLLELCVELGDLYGSKERI